MNPVLALILKAAVLTVLGALAVFAGSPLVQAIFRKADPPSSADDTTAAVEEVLGIRAAEKSLRGGRWIGMFERLAVYASILAGFSGGIAVVLAVKGLARYPELKATTPGASERFIIGTFSSVLFAAACAGVGWWLIGLW